MYPHWFSGSRRLGLAAGLLASAVLGLARVGVTSGQSPDASASRPASVVPTASMGTPAALPAWTDVRGKRYSAADIAKHPATVFLFTSSQCPIANIYTPRMIALGRDYAAKSVPFFLVHSNAEDTLVAVRRYATERRFPFPSVKDDKTTLADALGASVTPEAVVLDRQGVVRYRGRIDDNQDRDKIVRHDLRDALDALLDGKPVARPRTLAFGCTIFRDTSSVATQTASAKTASAKTASAKTVTYTRDVAPLLGKNCVSCHRPGEVGPFALQTYAQAKTWASAIKDYTAHRLMPPWKAAAGHGEFEDARALTDAEIATLARWVDAGAPEGDLRDLPPAPTFPAEAKWALGTPDLVLKSTRPYHLDADGKDVYRQFVLPIEMTDDRFLSAIEFKPDNRAVVHHMIAYLDPTGRSAALDGKDAEPGYTVPGAGIGTRGAVFLAGWAPGNLPRRLPPGTAYRLKKGARLVLQVHYHKTGKIEEDQSAIGVHFSKEPVEREMRTWAADNDTFVLKPGLAGQKVTGEFILPEDVHVWAVLPHMHMLGREMRLTAVRPDGTTERMIWINDWDFNWQETYAYKKPLALSKGTVVRVDAVFDNSEKNPHQPTLPPKEVRFGEQTTDEMCIGFFTVTVDRENLGIPGDQAARK